MLRGISRRTCVLLCASLLAMLSGCATKPLLSLEEHLEPRATIEPGTGVAVLKVQIGQGSFMPANARWMSLSLQDASGKISKPVWAHNVQPVHAEHSLFVFSLPAGNWRAATLETVYHVLNGTNTYRFPVEQLGEFSIRAGEITDLGAVTILPFGGTKLFGRRSARTTSQSMLGVVLPHSTAEANNLMSIIRSRMPQSLKVSTEPAWTLSPLQQEFQAPAIRQGQSQRYAAPVISGDTAWFGEEFGQIRIRRNQKTEWLDTGMTSHVNALARLDDGTLLAGGSHGVVLSRAPRASAWQTISLPLRDAVLVMLGHHPSLGIVAAARSGGQLVFFKTSSTSAPWVEIKRVSANGSISTQMQAAVTAKGLTAHVYELGFLAEGNLHHLDATSGLWTTTPLASGAISLTADGSIFTLAGSGFSPTTRVSSDGGKTWETRTSPSLPMMLNMLTAETGYIAKPDKLVLGPSSATFSVWKTTDGARSWTDTGRAPTVFTRIFRLSSTELGALTGSNALHQASFINKLYISTDEGKTWTEDDPQADVKP